MRPRAVTALLKNRAREIAHKLFVGEPVPRGAKAIVCRISGDVIVLDDRADLIDALQALDDNRDELIAFVKRCPPHEVPLVVELEHQRHRVTVMLSLIAMPCSRGGVS